MRRLLYILLLQILSTGLTARDSVLWRNIRQLDILYRQGLKDSAMASAQALLATASDQGDYMAQAMLHIMSGLVHSDRQDKQGVLNEFSVAAEIADTQHLLDETRGKQQYQFFFQTMIPVYAQLTLLCDELGYDEKSLTYAQRGMEWTEASSDPKKHAFAMAAFTEMAVKHGGKVTMRTGRDTAREGQAQREPPADVRPAAPAGQTPPGADTIRQKTIQTRVRYVPRQSKHLLVVGTLAGSVILAFLIYIIWQRSVRRRKEKEAQKQIDKSYREGQEQERSRLARELHDGVSNQLLAVEMKLRDEGRLSAQAIEMISNSRDQVRRVSHELLPPRFEHTTLNEALHSYADDMDGVGGCRVGYTSTLTDAGGKDIPPPTALEVYRIVQETVGNAIKHGQATSISIGLHQSKDGMLTVIVSDNGQSSPVAASSSGIGQHTVRQRAEAIGATLEQQRHPFGYMVKLSVRLDDNR